jgi:hypothetical protein
MSVLLARTPLGRTIGAAMRVARVGLAVAGAAVALQRLVRVARGA